MNKLICIAMILVATSALATPYIHQPINADGIIQGAAPDPLQTYLISDNYSHTVTVKGNIWYDLTYRGSGTCIVRLMNTVTKASYVAEPVAASGTSSYVIHGNTNFLNYSGCAGGTAPANSVLHLQ